MVHGDDLKAEVQKPSTILIPTDKKEPFQLDDMTEEEKERVKIIYFLILKI